MNSRKIVEKLIGVSLLILFIYTIHSVRDTIWIDGTPHDFGIILKFAQIGLLILSSVFLYPSFFKLYLHSILPGYFPDPGTPSNLTQHFVYDQSPVWGLRGLELLFAASMLVIYIFAICGMGGIVNSIDVPINDSVNGYFSLCGDLFKLGEMIILIYIIYIALSMLQKLILSRNARRSNELH